MVAFAKWYNEYYDKHPAENKYVQQHHETLLQALIVSRAMTEEIIKKVAEMKKDGKKGTLRK
jgi:hypothetical protein